MCAGLDLFHLCCGEVVCLKEIEWWFLGEFMCGTIAHSCTNMFPAKNMYIIINDNLFPSCCVDTKGTSRKLLIFITKCSEEVHAIHSWRQPYHLHS